MVVILEVVVMDEYAEDVAERLMLRPAVHGVRLKVVRTEADQERAHEIVFGKRKGG